MKIEFKDINRNIPSYCRKIMKEKDYPKTLEVYRGEMLCLDVNVEKASKLRFVENEKEGPMYKKYYDTGFLSQIA